MSDFWRYLTFNDYRDSISLADAADWITVAAYLAAGMATWRAARSAQRRRRGREHALWSIIAVLMVFFAVNELLDLQTVLTAIGKAWAKAGGWYEQRRVYQMEFVVALAAGAVVAGGLMLWLARGTHRSILVALCGMVFIGAFVLLRAVSFHHVDMLLGSGAASFNWGSIQEMAGIIIVAIAGLSYPQGSTRRKG